MPALNCRGKDAVVNYHLVPYHLLKESRKAAKNRDCVAVHTGVMRTIGVFNGDIYKKID